MKLPKPVKIKTHVKPPEDSSAAFGRHANGRMAQELFKNNPAEYARRRAEAERDGLLAPRPVWQDPDYRKRFDPVQKSEETLRLLADAPLCADAVKYYGSGASTGGTDTVSRLATEQPDYYKRVRACAIAKGFIEDRPAQPTPEPKPTSQWVTVPDDECDAAGLPRGYKTNQSGLELVKRIIKETAEAKAQAERDAQVAAERLARDAAVDASLSTVGAIRETHGTEAAVIAEGLQRDNVAKRTT